MSDITPAELAQIERFAKTWQLVGRMVEMEPADVLRLCDMARQVGELRQRVAELEASDARQPIETAPRDETRVLVYFPPESQWGEAGGVRSAQWDGVVCAWEVDALGMVEDCHGALLGPEEVGGPSHWRPMPGGPGDE